MEQHVPTHKKPKMRWGRRQPHGNVHNEWRSQRNPGRARTSASNELEVVCQIAAFLNQRRLNDDIVE